MIENASNKLFEINTVPDVWYDLLFKFGYFSAGHEGWRWRFHNTALTAIVQTWHESEQALFYTFRDYIRNTQCGIQQSYEEQDAAFQGAKLVKQYLDENSADYEIAANNPQAWMGIYFKRTRSK